MKVVTSSQMREIDRRTIEGIGIPSLVLMENAGRKVAEAIHKYFPHIKKIILLCGPGNNGGDGLVCARHLKLHYGKKVSVYLARKDNLSPDAEKNLRILENLNFQIFEWVNPPSIEESNLVVDALLGTGIKGKPEGKIADMIRWINASSLPVVSVDTPSGLSGDFPPHPDYTVKALITVTMALPKKEQVVFPGAEYVGKLIVADIGFPPSLLGSEEWKIEIMEGEKLKQWIKPRRPDTHKGTYGHILILSGSQGFTGAPLLTARGALRSGVGLITLGIPETIYSIVAGKIPEIIPFPLPAKEGGFTLSAWEKIKNWGRKITSLAMGPGISLASPVKEFVKKVIEESQLPMVVDADALTIISEDTSILKKAKSPLILTPHPGEMARLIGKDIDYVLNHRIEVALSFARKFNLILILKGARTVIATPEEKVFINPTGNPGMATGGMGDVLTGLIGGLLAQGYTPLESALIGVFIHGASGDILWEERKATSLTATEVAENIPFTFSRLREGYLDELHFYDKI
ncbi:MAG TPA: NAD(P)H-hydrate dehydratase [bacterium]|nr:NAD(P)H-hydrate dehydratase [bacterium]HEX68419.1 NAD(P)H-hydrate dehydratase [bacterium]